MGHVAASWPWPVLGLMPLKTRQEQEQRQGQGERFFEEAFDAMEIACEGTNVHHEGVGDGKGNSSREKERERERRGSRTGRRRSNKSISMTKTKAKATVLMRKPGLGRLETRLRELAKRLPPPSPQRMGRVADREREKELTSSESTSPNEESSRWALRCS